MKVQRKRRISGLVWLIPIIITIIFIRIITSAEAENSDSPAAPVVLLATETSAASLPEGLPYLENVPHIYQKDKYPTGCESVAAAALMQYYGMDISVEDFIDNHLPIVDYPYYEDNVMYGENPWDAFIGDPYSSSGYGCYSTAIVKAMKSAVSEQYEIHTVYNAPLALLCREYVDNEHPVLIWATMEMQEPYEGKTWTLPNGEIFTFISPEHALLLIGYDEEYYYFSDSMSTEAVVSYPKAATETAYDAMQRQAIVMMPMQ